MKKLRKILDDNGSDKSKKHLYDFIYESYLAPLREEPITFLEVGIFRGESIKAWLEYFPKASVHGIDLFDRIKPEDVEILKDKRVHWIESDSTDKNLPNLIKEQWGDIKFDVIIDDGLHTPEANEKTFLNLIEFLKSDGVYFIEDVFPLHMMTNKQLQHSWIKNHPNDFTKEKMLSLLKALSVYDTVWHDNRNFSKQPDSVIARIKKK
jgi:23S rRNA U2552 (ribose-2'-O)-methylase RlmE/FtsJ